MNGSYEDTKIVRTLGNNKHAATLGGLEVDTEGFSSALVVFDIGPWTDGTHTFGLEHSHDGSAWVVVPAGEIDGTLPVIASGTDDDKEYLVGYLGGRRYMRAVVDVAAATDGAIYGAIVVLQEPQYRPAT